MRSVFMGSRRLGGEKLTYHLLVEEVEGLGENYGVRLDGFGQTAAISGVTEKDDYPEGNLASGEYVIKAGGVL